VLCTAPDAYALLPSLTTTGRNEKKTVSLKRPRLEIVFDPDARKEHLTGFHKRKQERRRFGLAMQQIKDRKERLEERKERRAVDQDKLEELGLAERDLSEFNIREKRRREAAPDPEREAECTAYADDATHAMFGGDVTVTTTFGIAGNLHPVVDNEQQAHQCTL
jgi:ribosomal RNA-processing protein 17